MGLNKENGPKDGKFVDRDLFRDVMGASRAASR